MAAIPLNSGPIAKLLAQGVVQSGVAQVLRTVRKHLGMDVAFVSHFRDSDRVLEHVDAEGTSLIREGQAISLEDGYCLKVVRGELPQCIPDTSAVPAAKALPETQGIPIGAHLSVPIELSNGEVYGTLCCFSKTPNLSLGERDLCMMRALGEVLAARIDEDLAGARSKQHVADEIRRALSEGAPRIVYQPIYAFAGNTVAIVGVECLSRFDLEPRRAPDVWFNAVLCSVDLSRVVLEITEHSAVVDYEVLLKALAPLRARGVRLAIDDAGAGYASMRHILNLKPDVIKLDISLTRHIDTDANRRALAKGLIAFAHEIGSTITAEGVETMAELSALRAIGVDKVQGYFLSTPQALDVVVAAAEAESGTFQRAQVDEMSRAAG